VNTHNVLDYSQNMLQRLLDFIFPPHCGGCKKSGSVLCSSCISQFIPQHGRYHRAGLTGLYWAYAYEAPLKTCIHSLKYHGNIRIALPLGLLLAKAYRANNIRADLIIPVPLYADRLKERGYNQAHLLAQTCAQAVGVPLNTSILQKRRETQVQAQLHRHERYSNVAGAFYCQSPIATKSLENRRIVIIDDVSTTGATLEACAAPLFAAGASEVWGLVLAQRM
jgi:ComF family protein